jgi:hypothetical protein
MRLLHPDMGRDHQLVRAYPCHCRRLNHLSLEGSKGGDNGTRDTGNNTATGTTIANRAIVHADGTFVSTPCALHTDGEI